MTVGTMVWYDMWVRCWVQVRWYGTTCGYDAGYRYDGMVRRVTCEYNARCRYDGMVRHVGTMLCRNTVVWYDIGMYVVCVCFQ